MNRLEFINNKDKWYEGLSYLNPFEYASFNPRKAFTIFKSLDEEGFYYSKVVLGCLYLRGIGCECNKDRANYYFTEVMKIGNVDINKLIENIKQEDAKEVLYNNLYQLSSKIIVEEKSNQKKIGSEKSMLKHSISLNGKTILVTGSPGFIGANLVMRLLKDNTLMKSGIVISLDNMNDYYDVSLKEYRLSQINEMESQTDVMHVFIKGNIADKEMVNKVFEEYHPDIVVNLAAQAGVRYSIENPAAYIESNINGFFNILEACRKYSVEHLVYASSSSVYGSNAKVPYSTEDKVDNPVSLYAATKKSDELMAHSYSKLYNIPCTGLRFFTVYGPAGRPDMAYFGFSNKLKNGETIKIFNYGNCKRDFTYVDDIVEGIIRVMQGAPRKCTGADGLPIPPYAIYNIGNSKPENLLEFVNILQEELVAAGVLDSDYDFDSKTELVPMQPGDVPITFADTTALERDYGFKPSTPLREGLRKFALWYKDFYMGE